MSKKIESTTGVMLAGGKSIRMGRDKAFLQVGEGTLAENCLSILRACFACNIIIANRPAAFEVFQLPVIPDDLSDRGPLGGIYTALRHVNTPRIFVVACDMPVLDANLIRHMASALDDFDAVAAKIDGRFEPLHAGYQRRIISTVESRIQMADYSVHRLLEKLRVKTFSASDLDCYPAWRKTFLNVNTPLDLER